MTKEDLIELYRIIKSIYIARGFNSIIADAQASIFTYAIFVKLIDERSIINKMLQFAQEVDIHASHNR